MATESPTSLNAQDFSDSNDEFVDNFADGPDPNDDGTPLGVGGEKEKQAEPASSTLEADIVNGTTTQPGETKPPEDTAGEPDPVQEAAGEKGTETDPAPTTEEPETPEVQFSPVLLQMAGYADASAAQAAGFSTPEVLQGFIRGRGELLTPSVQSAEPTGQGLYQRPQQQQVTQPPPEVVAPTEPSGEIKPFQLPSEKMDMLDEDLQDVIRQMNEHYQQELGANSKELESLRASVGQRESDLAGQQEQEEHARFDKAVQDVGEDWQDVLGAGTIDDLGRLGRTDPLATAQIEHRIRLLDTVEAVREVNAKRGFKPMSIEQEVQWALSQQYPDKFQQTISGNSNGNGKERGVTASRPTQRNTPPASKDKLLLDLHKRFPHAGFGKQSEDDYDGEF